MAEAAQALHADRHMVHRLADSRPQGAQRGEMKKGHEGAAHRIDACGEAALALAQARAAVGQ